MSPDASPKRILMVDDDQDILLVISRRLQSWGYETLTVESGEAGLQLAQEQPFDLILLDMMMPRMKGTDVCIQLKANPKTQHIPVIFLSALADHIKEGLALGAADYIVKPFRPEELKERIALCLSRHGTPPTA